MHVTIIIFLAEALHFLLNPCTYTDTEKFQVVEFISVLLTVGSDAAEKELISLGAVQRILDLFFK